jgi:archaellum component FlaD/FlaE
MYENQKQNKESMKVEELSIERAKKINDENISNKTKEKNIINNSSNNNIENAQKSEEEINNNKEKRSNPEINSKKSSKKGSKISEINSIEDLKANMKENCIPESFVNMTIDNYDEFLKERRKLMAQKIKDYYNTL